MVLSKKHLIKLINTGQAVWSGGDEKRSLVKQDDVLYAAVDRIDKQCVDH